MARGLADTLWKAKENWQTRLNGDHGRLDPAVRPEGSSRGDTSRSDDLGAAEASWAADSLDEGRRIHSRRMLRAAGRLRDVRRGDGGERVERIAPLPLSYP